MIKCCILILFSALQLFECRENYRIHEVNMKVGNSAISMIGEVVDNGYTFAIRHGFVEKDAVSSAILIEQINATGWGHLLVKSSSKYSDELQAYFSGVTESLISRELIAAHYYNTVKGYCSVKSVYCTRLDKYLRENFHSLVDKTRKSSGYLKMMRLQLWQMKGIQDGYNGKWKRNSIDINEDHLLTMKDELFQLYLLQLTADLMSLSKILGGQKYHTQFSDPNPFGESHCSALIKYINGSIFSSHVTWNYYNTMLRLTKMYDFPYRLNDHESSSPVIPAQKLSFSSYPAVIVSLDDFYITSAGLVTIETTISNCNSSLWKPLQTMASEVIFEFMRVQAANRLSKSGSEWSQLFGTNNSGTYNNQWMIVNHNVMKGHRYGERIPDGALYIAEQIPSLIVYEDVTEFLRRLTYWPSYNIPYNKTIWKMGAFQRNVDKYGDFYDYNKSPRARMFKRDAHKVVDEISLMRLMRYNDFENDPFAKCKCKPPYSGVNGISARCDLNPKNGSYPFILYEYNLFGGIDMKFTTSELAEYMRFVGIMGPTYDQQPVFDWSKNADNITKHKMHPQRFQFPPMLTPFT